MRFKEASKVEVLSKIDMPSGSWHCAEIVCGNGHAYTVRYVGHSGSNDGAVTEIVSEKQIRPCPPLRQIAENWVPGDVVELFNNFSWKMATICKVLCKEYFLVRLLGSLLEFKVSRFDIRTRQSWQDGKWILIGKSSGSCEDIKHDRNSILKFKSRNKFQIKRTRSNEYVTYDFCPGMNHKILQESNDISCKKLKRRLYGDRAVEAYDGSTRKHKAVEKEGKLRPVAFTNQSLSHDIAFRNGTIGEKVICSLDYQSRLSEMDTAGRQQTGNVGYSSVIKLDSDDEASSVGSCSTMRKSFRKFQYHSDFVEDIDDNYSDAECFCQRGKKEGNIILPTKQELAAKIHMLELHAYRCTMEALYASGPLSWDKEAMVTNLRLSLHISNDEHLMEGQSWRIYHLISQC